MRNRYGNEDEMFRGDWQGDRDREEGRSRGRDDFGYGYGRSSGGGRSDYGRTSWGRSRDMGDQGWGQGREDERGIGRDYGSRDWGAREFGGRDYGNRDYGSRDWGQSGMDRDYGYGRDYTQRSFTDRDREWSNRGYPSSMFDRDRYDQGRSMGSGWSGGSEWRSGSPSYGHGGIGYEADRGRIARGPHPVEDASRRFDEQGQNVGDRMEDIGYKVMHGIKRWFRGPKGYKRADDRIREDVCDRLNHLAQHSQVDCGDVEVSVKDGEVTLSGFVEERRWKRMLEEVAEDVTGVTDVHNMLRVKSREEMERTQTGTTTGTATTTGTSTTGSTLENGARRPMNQSTNR